MAINIGGTIKNSPTAALGDHNNGPVGVELVLNGLEIPDNDTPVKVALSVVNAGSSNSNALGQIVVALASEAADALVPGSGDFVAFAAKVLGLASIIQPNCDGPCVAVTSTISGRDLASKTSEGSEWVINGTDYGYPSDHGCGSNSNYGYTAIMSRDFDSGKVLGDMAAVFEPQTRRDHSSLFFVADGRCLHFFYVTRDSEGNNPAWHQDWSSFNQAGVVSGPVAAVYEPQRAHAAVFLRGKDGYLHYFYVEHGAWQHDGTSFRAAGQVTGAISAVFEPQRNHSGVFFRGGDGNLHYFYLAGGGWAHDGGSFTPAGQVTGAISAVFEPLRNHPAVFFRGGDASVHYFYLSGASWAHDGSSFAPAGQVTGPISAVFEPLRNHSAIFVTGADGYLHYFYVPPGGGWTHDTGSFRSV